METLVDAFSKQASNKLTPGYAAALISQVAPHQGIFALFIVVDRTEIFDYDQFLKMFFSD